MNKHHIVTLNYKAPDGSLLYKVRVEVPEVEMVKYVVLMQDILSGQYMEVPTLGYCEEWAIKLAYVPIDKGRWNFVQILPADRVANDPDCWFGPDFHAMYSSEAFDHA
jgi:hypothetical protein